MRTKVFVEHNHDGVNRAMVAAQNLKEAAELLHTTVYQMRQMGWDYASGDIAAIALAQPGVAFFCPIDSRGGEYPWREKRWHKKREGGWE